MYKVYEVTTVKRVNKTNKERDEIIFEEHVDLYESEDFLEIANYVNEHTGIDYKASRLIDIKNELDNLIGFTVDYDDTSMQSTVKEHDVFTTHYAIRICKELF